MATEDDVQKIDAWKRAGSVVMREGLRDYPTDAPQPPQQTHPREDFNSSQKIDDTEDGAVGKERTIGRYRTIKGVMGPLYIDYMDLQIRKKLGEGAFAQVYHGILTTSHDDDDDDDDGGGGGGGAKKSMGYRGNKDVAVKMLKHEHLKNMSEVFMFLKEFKTLKHLHHPSIVELIGIGGVQNAEGSVVEMFIVTELCRGGTLRNLVQDQMITVFRKQYSLYDAARWSLQIAEALQYLHRCIPIVIHRDLKLENIILTNPPRRPSSYSFFSKNETDRPAVDAKLADFGLATLLATPQRQLYTTLSGTVPMNTISEDVGSGPTHRTQCSPRTHGAAKTNKVIGMLERMRTLSSFGSMSGESISSGPVEMTGVAGSYGYMAPEVFRDEQYNEKVDIFSLGVVMYNLCYRTIPALAIMSNGDCEDMVVYAKRVADGFRQPLKDDKVPAELNRIIEACWSQNPSDRPCASTVVERMRALFDSGCIVKEEDDAASGNGCSCCSLIAVDMERVART